jgi:DNA-binding transcriptional regulator YdaS (Cro superfamily)
MTTTTEQCEAVGKLSDWLAADEERCQAWLAAKCGVKPPSVNAWMSRQSRPITYLREVIEVLTDGYVQCPDWDLPSERVKRDDAIRQIRAEATNPVRHESNQ